ncbi:exopolysaccharide biosynthesis protein [Heliorestis acidaminivorans]|uniref:Exopolysaccharide biosynthesis protein n=1 Tax=Heliorestis acidaminivorans TaxID=553427 RepID=A0A6I0F1Y7_9FIRM|nr:exopolysaccharide biosynthesis protein [Heliorestis acidaminivorans]KAB2953328.1 exopolysaccharide biosynthesis protein [Heliorestis acidaminivorans]
MLANKSRIKHQSFSKLLLSIARNIPGQGMTIRQLIDQLGERGLLTVCMVLTLPFLIPLSIPGSSIPFGLAIILAGMALILNRPLWLPQGFADKEIASDSLKYILESGAKLLAKLEKLMRPRFLVLTEADMMIRFNVFLIIFSAFLLMAPLPLPLSNTIPAYAVLFLAAGSLERDGYLLIAGYLLIIISLIYFAVVALLGAVGMEVLFLLTIEDYLGSLMA